ncbi:T9SS type A sorting domain-containing protein [Algibacter amylolyticus]|uniref:T9SS type A sorting domain-containing protein n=1 Tax=Algibacter amylolyticus TaxID=1608400 RepID=A0A5M7B485_9FLAO|nr:T9SS type A sorting domain-containing protein [Algibacter amylolyticus]KAA5823610.1 T9SS type A sorting domain-containing protein [Algibacter amylolyticus]MBB5267769.1 hypothetical protein [Algibacter amylolyticus]TSJ74098.1 T9SS type A sorting domain-containing protein [Algibacter amylolyticus]
MKKITLLLLFFTVFQGFSQNLGQGYIANDLVQHPMQELDKPDYLEAVTDPSFTSTQIRRITQATAGNYVKPMYSTIQAWNADESLLIVYGGGVHQLLNGTDYTFIRNLSDVFPDDIETIFWSFTDPNVFFYMDGNNDDLISYNVQTQVKTILVNIRTLSGCPPANGLTGGNDIQMMSWDNDVFAFRCGNDAAYYYRISTQSLTQFNIANIEYTAPMPFPSGNLFFHKGAVYDGSGQFVRNLNVNGIQHSCLGKLGNGDDAYYNVNFEEGRYGGCQGTLVAHNATTGNCFAVTSYTDYDYPKSGTHISALAHKNLEDGWVAVSCLGFERDGVKLLDQELFVAKVNETDADVYRVAHHRSDESPFSYAGEPHVTISPTGTRLLFASDWSGAVDGDSVDTYVAELASYTLSSTSISVENENMSVYPNPAGNTLHLASSLNQDIDFCIKDVSGKVVYKNRFLNEEEVDISFIANGLYFATFTTGNTIKTIKFIKK